MAIGMILYPELFKTKKVNISVDEKGYTKINENKAPNAEIGVWIDSNEFIKRLKKAYLYQNLER